MAISVVQTGVVVPFLNGAITAPLQAFTDTTDAPFSSALITNNPNTTIRQAGPASSDLVTTFTQFVSASAATTDNAAGTTQASTAWVWGVGTLGTNGTTSLSIALPQAILRGDLFAVFVQTDFATGNPRTVSSIVDSSGNSYVLATTGTVVSGGTTALESGYYAKDMAPAAPNTNTVTVTMSRSFAGSDAYMAILHIRGADAVLPLDVADTNTGTTGTALTSNSYSTKFQNEIIVSYSGAFAACTAGQDGYTVGPQDPVQERYQYIVVNSRQPAGTTTQFTQSSSSAWMISTMSFRTGGFPLRASMQPRGL